MVDDEAGESPVTVALYGATGALGREVLVALEGEGLAIAELLPVAGGRSAGEDVPFRGRSLSVLSSGEVDPASLDIAILALPPAIADGLRGPLKSAGVFVLDASPSATSRGALPALWPGLNDDALETHPGGVALPCVVASTVAPLLRALADVLEPAALDVVALLGSTASGRRADEALGQQTLALMSHRPPDPGPFAAVLAFNTLAGSPEAGGGVDPWEAGALSELRALSGLPEAVPIRATAVQVPVFAATTIAVTLRPTDATRCEDPAALLARVHRALDASTTLVRTPERLAARDALELETILVGTLSTDPDGAVRAVLAADGLHRTGQAAAAVLARVVAEDLW